MFGIRYGPDKNCAMLRGATRPLVRIYAPTSQHAWPAQCRESCHPARRRSRFRIRRRAHAEWLSDFRACPRSISPGGRSTARRTGSGNPPGKIRRARQILRPRRFRSDRRGPREAHFGRQHAAVEEGHFRGAADGQSCRAWHPIRRPDRAAPCGTAAWRCTRNVPLRR